MREVEVGVRVDLQAGLSFFGAEEGNALIRQGGRVAAVEPGGAILRKLGEEGANVRLTPSGFSLKVRVEVAGDGQDTGRRADVGGERRPDLDDAAVHGKRDSGRVIRAGERCTENSATRLPFGTCRNSITIWIPFQFFEWPYAPAGLTRPSSRRRAECFGRSDA